MGVYFYPFGKIELSVDEIKTEYNSSQLPIRGIYSQFLVDNRTKISITVPPISSPKIIMCYIKPDEGHLEFRRNYESGEQLVAVSFDRLDCRLTIGTVGDLSDRKYCYQDNGLKIILFESTAEREITFCIAQKNLHGDTNDVDTWLAADLYCK